jgi:hypothetical protein
MAYRLQCAGAVRSSPRAIPLRFVVFCFAKAEDAEAFAKRFGGDRLKTGSRC